MGTTNRLVYDPTDADTIASSSTIGAYLLAGDDGAAIGSTGNALNVNLASIGVADIDIRDLAAATDSVSAWLKDGSGTSITSTAGALDVNIASGFVDVDDSLANTAIESTAKSVTTTTGVILASALANRKWYYMQNLGSKNVYIGKSGVTTSNGFEISPKGAIELRLGASVALHGVALSGTQDCRVMELS